MTGNQILKIQNHSFIDQIIVQKAVGLKEHKQKEVEKFYSVQGLFAVRIEGFEYVNSVRFTEERIILVKAVDLDEALKKAKNEFMNYSDFEYLNSDARLTRWEFIDILDTYETCVEKIDPNGTEIFSVTQNRKLKG